MGEGARNWAGDSRIGNACRWADQQRPDEHRPGWERRSCEPGKSQQGSDGTSRTFGGYYDDENSQRNPIVLDNRLLARTEILSWKELVLCFSSSALANCLTNLSAEFQNRAWGGLVIRPATLFKTFLADGGSARTHKSRRVKCTHREKESSRLLHRALFQTQGWHNSCNSSAP